GFDGGDPAYALSRAPDVFPGLALGAAQADGLVAGARQPVGIPACLSDAGTQVAAGDAGEVGCVDDIAGLGFDQHLFVGLLSPGFGAGDETGAYIGEVGTHGQGGQDVLTA